MNKNVFSLHDFIKGGNLMLKRTTSYLIALIIILTFLVSVGCPKSPTEPSYSGPNPAPGFEISFFRWPSKDSRPGYWVYSSVSYKGEEGGIESAYVKAGDGLCKDWHRVGGTSQG